MSVLPTNHPHPLSATVRDQFGAPIEPQPDLSGLTWAVTAGAASLDRATGGTVNITASAGEVTVTASEGSLTSATVTMTFQDPVPTALAIES